MKATESSNTSIFANPSAKKRALGLIFFIMLMDIVGLTIIIPVAPFIVERYTKDAFAVTALTGIYAAAQFFAAPLLGNISDRIGRRPVLLICVLGSALGYFMFGLGGSLWVLFLSRVIDGFTGGNLSTASAYIADISTPEERPKNFAMIGIAFGLGFILGPALGGLASQISIDAPAFLAGIISLVSVAVMYFMLPESLPKERREKKALILRDANPLIAIGEMARKPGMLLLFSISLIFAFVFNGLNTVLGKYVAERYGAQPGEISTLFVVAGIITAISQATLVERTVKRFGEKTMTIVALVGLCLGSIVIAFAPAFWWLYPTPLLRNGLGGFIWGTLAAMTANKVLPREQGKLAGVNTALQSLMGVLGPLAAGLAYDYILPNAPFWIGAIIFAVGALIALRIQVTPKQPPVGMPQPTH